MTYYQQLQIIKQCVNDALLSLKEVVIDIKDDNNLVTSTDIHIEKSLIKTIKQHFPQDLILSEEFNNHRNLQGRTWIIDPIDGTSNYAAGLKDYCVQVALWENDQLVLSYINVFPQQKEYYAIVNEGAYLNGQRIYATTNKVLSNALMSFIGSFRLQKNMHELPYDILQTAINANMKVRILGSVGVEMALMAEGVYSALYTPITNIYDVAPGFLLMKEAGCLIRNEKNYQLGADVLFVFGNETLSSEFDV